MIGEVAADGTGSGSVPSVPTRKAGKSWIGEYGARGIATRAARAGRVASRSVHGDVLIEADAEHRDLDALHGIRAIVNHGESAADDGLLLAQQLAHKAVLDAGVPGESDARRNIAVIGVIDRPLRRTDRLKTESRIVNIPGQRRLLLLLQE